MDTAIENIVASHTKQSSHSDRVVRDTEKLSGTSLMLRSSALRALKHEKSLLSEDDNLQTSIKVAQSIINLIQIDTHGELEYKNKLISSDEGLIAKRIGQAKDLIDLVAIYSRRDLLYLMISNCFNRADELAETALQVTNSNNIGSDLGVNFLSKARIAEYRDDKNTPVRVTFGEAITHIQKLAKHWNVDCDSWGDKIQLIIEAQLNGMDLVKRLKNGEKYSIDDATKYRRDTIGQYGLLLGEIAFGEGSSRSIRMQNSFLEIQIDDDINDIEDDLYSQVNPFIALLDSFNKKQEYLGFLKSGRDGHKFVGLSDQKIFQSFINTLPEETKASFKAAFVITKRSYFEP